MSYRWMGVWALASATAAVYLPACGNHDSFGGGDAASGDATASDANRSDGALDANCTLASDANLSLLTAGDASGARCATCVLGMCGRAVTDCERDCSCVMFFTCIGRVLSDAGAGKDTLSTCAGGEAGVAALETNPAVEGLYGCYSQTCANACMPSQSEGGTQPDSGNLNDGGLDGASPEAGNGDGGGGDGESPESGASEAGPGDGGLGDASGDAADSG